MVVLEGAMEQGGQAAGHEMRECLLMKGESDGNRGRRTLGRLSWARGLGLLDRGQEVHPGNEASLTTPGPQ